MIGLTLADIERELGDLADEADDDANFEFNGCSEVGEKLRKLARRISVQIETDKLGAAA